MLERPFTDRIAGLLSRLGYLVIICAMVGATNGLSRALFGTPLTSALLNSEEEEKEPRERHLVAHTQQLRRPLKAVAWTKPRPPLPEHSSPSLSVNATSALILCGAGIYQRC